jgi:anti-sigma factor RsiW
MDHAEAQNEFSDFVDGTLPDLKRVEVEQHLAICIQCRTELAAFKKTLGTLGRLKQTAPPSFLIDVKQQIYKRSRGRFFAPRWKLFGKIPFEWISLGTIIAMLVYYLAVLHGSPAAVHGAP